MEDFAAILLFEDGDHKISKDQLALSNSQYLHDSLQALQSIKSPSKIIDLREFSVEQWKLYARAMKLRKPLDLFNVVNYCVDLIYALQLYTPLCTLLRDLTFAPNYVMCKKSPYEWSLLFELLDNEDILEHTKVLRECIEEFAKQYNSVKLADSPKFDPATNWLFRALAVCESSAHLGNNLLGFCDFPKRGDPEPFQAFTDKVDYHFRYNPIRAMNIIYILYSGVPEDSESGKYLLALMQKYRLSITIPMFS